MTCAMSAAFADTSSFDTPLGHVVALCTPPRPKKCWLLRAHDGLIRSVTVCCASRGVDAPRSCPLLSLVMSGVPPNALVDDDLRRSRSNATRSEGQPAGERHRCLCSEWLFFSRANIGLTARQPGFQTAKKKAHTRHHLIHDGRTVCQLQAYCRDTRRQTLSCVRTLHRLLSPKRVRRCFERHSSSEARGVAACRTRAHARTARHQPVHQARPLARTLATFVRLRRPADSSCFHDASAAQESRRVHQLSQELRA